LPDETLAAALIVAVAMLCGGAVKGVVGLGLPIVAISIMSTFLSVPTALALVIGPTLLSNLWQLLRARYALQGLRRFWPVLVTLAVGLWASASLVVRVSPAALYGILGTIVVVFSLSAFMNPHLRVPAGAEKWLGAVAGLAGGLIGGVSTVYGPPVTMYLVALHLPKEIFIGAVGLIWFVAALPLTAAYVFYGVLTAELAPWSALACAPALGGFLVGQWIRDRIDQESFRKVLLGFLVLLGLNLIRRAVV
jgi:uncharacterized membrane protein YfcA